MELYQNTRRPPESGLDSRMAGRFDVKHSRLTRTKGEVTTGFPDTSLSHLGFARLSSFRCTFVDSVPMPSGSDDQWSCDWPMPGRAPARSRCMGTGSPKEADYSYASLKERFRKLRIFPMPKEVRRGGQWRGVRRRGTDRHNVRLRKICLTTLTSRLLYLALFSQELQELAKYFHPSVTIPCVSCFSSSEGPSLTKPPSVSTAPSLP